MFIFVLVIFGLVGIYFKVGTLTFIMGGLALLLSELAFTLQTSHRDLTRQELAEVCDVDFLKDGHLYDRDFYASYRSK